MSKNVPLGIKTNLSDSIGNQKTSTTIHKKSTTVHQTASGVNQVLASSIKNQYMPRNANRNHEISISSNPTVIKFYQNPQEIIN